MSLSCLRRASPYIALTSVTDELMQKAYFANTHILKIMEHVPDESMVVMLPDGKFMLFAKIYEYTFNKYNSLTIEQIEQILGSPPKLLIIQEIDGISPEYEDVSLDLNDPESPIPTVLMECIRRCQRTKFTPIKLMFAAFDKLVPEDKKIHSQIVSWMGDYLSCYRDNAPALTPEERLNNFCRPEAQVPIGEWFNYLMQIDKTHLIKVLCDAFDVNITQTENVNQLLYLTAWSFTYLSSKEGAGYEKNGENLSVNGPRYFAAHLLGLYYDRVSSTLIELDKNYLLNIQTRLQGETCSQVLGWELEHWLTKSHMPPSFNSYGFKNIYQKEGQFHSH